MTTGRQTPLSSHARLRLKPLLLASLAFFMFAWPAIAQPRLPQPKRLDGAKRSLQKPKTGPISKLQAKSKKDTVRAKTKKDANAPILKKEDSFKRSRNARSKSKAKSIPKARRGEGATPHVAHTPTKINVDPKTAAFIIVQAAFDRTQITVDGVPYPERSQIGLPVTPGVTHEVIVKNEQATFTYKVSLSPHEARVFMVDLSSGYSLGGGVSKARPNRKGKGVDKDKKKKDDKNESGYLTINASNDSKVYIDGKLVAQSTPLKRHKLSVGRHTVRVFYKGSGKFSETRRAAISKGRHISLHFQDPSGKNKK